MTKKSTIMPADLKAFKEAMKGTKPLAQKQQRIQLAPAKTQKRRPTTMPSTESLQHTFHFHESYGIDPVDSEGFLSYKHSSISNKRLRKLRDGQYNVEATLDLHGMTIEEAKVAIDHFLQECLRHHFRAVLIIHGKGHGHQPILKNKLNHWLREIPVVLAFCSAAPLHGGRGAMYVLLKHVG